jgi:adenylosuccinate lyase
MLCWLALLLTRTIATTCDATWPALRHELERIKVGTFTGPAGTFHQRTELTTSQRAILAKLQLADPPRIYQLTPAAQPLTSVNTRA